MTRLFPKTVRPGRESKLESITLRNFGGGLNGVDDDISMEPRFLCALTNFRRTASGGQQVRLGSRWFADVAGIVTGDIVDQAYFNGRIVVPTTTGQIATVDDAGVVRVLWTPAIANALPSHPVGWVAEQTLMDFVQFKDELIIHNGIDKPVVIASDFTITYLQDKATGSNLNVPIGKFGCTAANYHCVAGIPAAPTEIYISNAGAAGTFPGDLAPNDAISIDVGAYAPEGASAIRGIAGFRSYLLVFFQQQTLLVKLGVYDDEGRHKPEFPDAMPHFGLLGHRCTVQLENDLQFAGFDGVSSAKRNLFSGLIDSNHLSDVIEPIYRRSVGASQEDDLTVRTFIVYEHTLHDTVLQMTDGRAFVYSANEKLRYRGWSQYATPSWRSGCTSQLGRVFYSLGSRLYLSGNETYPGEDTNADLVNDRDYVWTPKRTITQGDIVWDADVEKSYFARVTHTSGFGSFADDRLTSSNLWEAYLGEPIRFVMELPWIEGRDPMKVKQLRYGTVASKGTGRFTLEAYVDNLGPDPDAATRVTSEAHLRETADDDVRVVFSRPYAYSPSLAMDFIGNDAIGFGFDDGPFGGGRRSTDPRLFSFPLKFKNVKFRIVGADTRPLQIINMSFLFSRGRYKR